jgi:hypothetical protein
MSCAMKKMDIRTLYKDDEITLQKLIITVGTCRMVKYRQIKNGPDLDLEVIEVKEPPAWYLRWRKLKQIGI